MGVSEVIYFCVGDRETRICSYVWRLWWGRTSFYVKARYEPLAGLKVSLHGPSKEHSKPGFKVGLDEGARRKATAAGGLYVATEDWLPQWFEGRSAGQGVMHVLRFRTTWDLFAHGVPSAPPPGDVKASAFAGLIPPPPPYNAVDVDVFVSKSRPHWPNERQARLDNACLGPLQSEAGEYLTAVAVKRSILKSRTPSAALATPPRNDEDRVRGVGATVDDGLLWICEQWMSRSALLHQTYQGES
jgi:hypothetical protein